jgi:hypothetical protein
MISVRSMIAVGDAVPVHQHQRRRVAQRAAGQIAQVGQIDRQARDAQRVASAREREGQEVCRLRQGIDELLGIGRTG